MKLRNVNDHRYEKNMPIWIIFSSENEVFFSLKIVIDSFKKKLEKTLASSLCE